MRLSTTLRLATSALFLSSLIALSSLPAHALATIETYPSAGVHPSTRYTVEVLQGASWIPSPVYSHSRKSVTFWHGYETPYPSANFTTFGTTEATSVRISGLGATTVKNAQISPKYKKFSVQVVNGQVIVQMAPGDKAWVTINYDDANPLLIFADGLKPPVPAGANYFGPGQWDIAPGSDNHYAPKNNETIYLDGGAWVRGTIDVRGRTGVKIMGPGVLSGEQWTSEVAQALPTFDQQLAYVMIRGDFGGSNATVSGPTILASPFYNFFGGVTDADNVKLISPWYWSTDGFPGVNHVSHAFAFVGDNVFFPDYTGINGLDMTAKSSFVVSTNNGVFCGGYWGNNATNQYPALVDDIDVKSYTSDTWLQYGSPLTPAIFQIWVDSNNSKSGYWSQTYQNIRIEGSLTAPLMMMKNMLYPWDTNNAPNPPLGNSTNLVFRNITLEGTQKYMNEIAGYDAANGFHNITLENWRLKGVKVTTANLSQYFNVNPYVWNLTVK